MLERLRIATVALLVIGLSGAVPAFAQVGEAQVDCCAGAEEEGDVEVFVDLEDGSGREHAGSDDCPPACDDCVCRTISVVFGSADRFGLTAFATRIVAVAREPDGLMLAPPARGVFRPPRAHA